MNKKENSKKRNQEIKEEFLSFLKDDVLDKYFSFRANKVDFLLVVIVIFATLITRNIYIFISLYVLLVFNIFTGIFFVFSRESFNKCKGFKKLKCLRKVSEYLKEVSEFNFITGMVSFIWITSCGGTLILETIQLAMDDPSNIQYYVFSTEILFLIFILPFWYKYERFCVEKLKNTSKPVATFNAKSIRFMLVAVASLCVISINIFAVASHSFALGTDPEDLQLVTNIACIAGGFATVLYPIIDMFILTRNTIDNNG